MNYASSQLHVPELAGRIFSISDGRASEGLKAGVGGRPHPVERGHGLSGVK